MCKNMVRESAKNPATDEFYAWNDFKSDFRKIKQAGNAFLDGMDDLAADLDSGLDFLENFGEIELAANIDYSRFELTRQDWQ
jgi:hypothetical protein